MKIELKVMNAFPCRTNLLKINGIKALQDWFVDNYDDGSEEENYCCNMVTEYLPIVMVRKKLPKELKSLTDNEILEIQDKLFKELCSGSCGLCA